jgi:dihydroxy-acid dehydratase
MVSENLTPSKILTREAFENAIVVCSAIGGSTNCPPHVNAIARHIGVDLPVKDWETVGHAIPLLANISPAGKYLGEDYHRAGGVPAIFGELIRGGKIRTSAITVTGKPVGEVYAGARTLNPEVIRPFENPLMHDAGFLVLTGNLFDSALMKTSVLGEEFRRRFLSTPGDENAFEGKAIVFEGPEDYHVRINDESLGIDEHSILVIRGTGPVGYPGSAEVVNMQPPDALIKRGVRFLPTIGDGRQSGTSDSPSILNASPESAVGGNLAILRTGDRLRVDLNKCRVDIQISDEEIAARHAALNIDFPANQTPWQQIYRETVGQLEAGGVMEFAVKYQNIAREIPRHNH